MCSKNDDPTQHDIQQAWDAEIARLRGTEDWARAELMEVEGPPPRGGWVNRARSNTLPVFTTHQSAFAYLPGRRA